MTTLTDIPITKIEPHPKNVRRVTEADDELINSVREQGILQPLVVIADGKKYLLIAGHRRLAAARAVKVKTVPAVIHDHLDTEAKQIEAMLVENGRRVDLSPIEEAAAYEQLTLLGVDTKEIATTTGRSATTVKQRLTLTRLPKKAGDALHGHQITLGQAEQLLELESHPDLLKEAVSLMGHDNFDYIVRSRVGTARKLDEEAELRTKYQAMGLPQIKQPKGGWDYNTGPRPAHDGETPDAWWPGGKDHWNTTPQLIVTKVAGRKKSAADLKREKQWEKEQAQRKAQVAAEELARRMRLEHVADLAAGMKMPTALAPHLHAGVARIVAGMTNGDIDDVASASGVELTKVKNDYHNDAIANQILQLPAPQLLAVFGAAIALQATSLLYLGYGEAKPTQLENATTYWDAFDRSGYPFPDIDTKARQSIPTAPEGTTS